MRLFRLGLQLRRNRLPNSSIEYLFEVVRLPFGLRIGRRHCISGPAVHAVLEQDGYRAGDCIGTSKFEIREKLLVFHHFYPWDDTRRNLRLTPIAQQGHGSTVLEWMLSDARRNHGVTKLKLAHPIQEDGLKFYRSVGISVARKNLDLGETIRTLRAYRRRRMRAGGAVQHR